MFHVQSEDRGRRSPIIQTVVFHDGEVIAAHEASYADYAEAEDFTEREIARRLIHQHRKQIAEIYQGCFDLAFGPTDVAEYLRLPTPLVASEASADPVADPSPSGGRRELRARKTAAVVSLAAGLAIVAVLVWLIPAATEPTPPPLVVDAGPPSTPSRAPAPVQAPGVRVARRTPLPDGPPPSFVPVGAPVRLTWALPEAPDPAVGEPSPPVRVEAASPVVAVLPPAPESWAGKLVEWESLDEAPVPVRRELPRYTRRARKHRVQGDVELSLLVDERGAVQEVRLVQGLSDAELNRSVVDVAGGWFFRPARKSGDPVRVWTPARLEFAIEDGQTRIRAAVGK